MRPVMGVGYWIAKAPRLLPSSAVPILILLCLFGFLGSDAQQLPKQEVAALQKIASKLNVGFWDFTKDPCSKGGQWMNVTNTNIKRNVTCSCNTTCNVVSILLKGQNLTGILPADFANLTSLTEIDLSRNYISGSIPTAWASLPLVSVSLLGNRLSGQIPKEIGNIATLQSLVLENNMFQGPLPPALGSLTNLTRLLLSANNFTGELPQSLGNLKNLEDFRIDGNGISGSIPSFIGNWTGLQRLDMQGTSLGGPFPFTFSNLTALTDLRISDFKGDGNFPPLQKMIVMENLALRNCSLSGQIPSYIGTMSLKLLDLSFNNFTGAIPGKLAQLSSINNMYLTNNMLTGSIPSWILSSKRSLDVSYNNFSGSPSPSTCQQGNVNLVASYSSSESNVINTCLRRNQPCQGKPMNYELFINCGGMRVNFNNSEYQEDSSPIGMSTYFSSPDQKWAYSSTGDFLGSSQAKYLATNMSKLNFTNPELYMSARLSPLSLRYYGLCLQKGNYTVNLHFAEIMFTDDQTYYSVGRRIFEVSIQGQKVLKDFNIAEAANGTHKEIIKPFTAFVEDGTLEIHLQWVGKGTNAIPDRGVYGPLISAITVRPNFKPDLGHHKLSVGAIVGIVIASCVLVIMMLFFLWFYLRKSKENDELRGLELQTGYFSLRQIKTATRNFDPENKIGEGGFGPVYKGVLPDGTFIAVKQLSSKSKQGNREFVNEIGMISALQHPNLAKLFGCCIEGNQLSLIYEYLENNSLARALFGREGVRLKLDWPTRCKILLGVARGLAYLHEESILKIVHRDIKATNVLLDKDLNAKISDFGLAKLDEEENTHISTRIAGTVGYMAPEYAMRGYLTDKADVYSYGIVVLETISGKSNTNYRPKDEFVYLLDWAYVLQEQGTLLELVDPSLSSHYSKEEAQQFLNLALVCTNPSPTLRPKMSAVVSMLEGQAPVRVPSVKSGHYSNEDMRFKSFEKLSHDSQVRGFSMDGPWTNPSVSVTSSKEDMTSHTSTSKFMHDYTD